jgi:hypothetical protein
MTRPSWRERAFGEAQDCGCRTSELCAAHYAERERIVLERLRHLDGLRQGRDDHKS